MAFENKVIIKDRGANRIEKDLKKIGQIDLKIGLFGSGGGPEVNMAARGALHQFGETGTVKALIFGDIPRRPFMSQAFDKGLKSLKKFILIEEKKVIAGSQGVDQFIKRIGEYHKGQIFDIYITGDFEKNAEITIQLKGSSRPLIDTGDMRRRTDYRIEKK